MHITVIKIGGQTHHCTQEELENYRPERLDGTAKVLLTYSVDLSEDVTTGLKAHQAIGDALSSVREIARKISLEERASALLCDEQSQSKDGRTDYFKVLLDLCDQIESELGNL